MYTKGEWEVIEYPVQGHYVGNGEVTIATIHEGIPEAQANAHLIAAAPDLYEEIRTTIEELETYQGEWLSVTELYAPEWTHEIKRIIFHLEQALAKAEGK